MQHLVKAETWQGNSSMFCSRNSFQVLHNIFFKYTFTAAKIYMSLLDTKNFINSLNFALSSF